VRSYSGRCSIWRGASGRIYRALEFAVDFFRSTSSTAIFPISLLPSASMTTKIYVATFAASLAIRCRYP
jgi:NitT/TauT family transport system permease protein